MAFAVGALDVAGLLISSTELRMTSAECLPKCPHIGLEQKVISFDHNSVSLILEGKEHADTSADTMNGIGHLSSLMLPMPYDPIWRGRESTCKSVLI